MQPGAFHVLAIHSGLSVGLNTATWNCGGHPEYSSRSEDTLLCSRRGEPMHVFSPGFVPRLSARNPIHPVRRSGRLAIVLTCLASGIVMVAVPAAEPAGPGPAAELPKPTRLQLETGDRRELATWYYPVRDGATPLATVLLLHDLGGSHESVEPLALALQAAGSAVVAPDLRGHGESVDSELERASGSRAASELLKSKDFLAMIATGGSRVRDQASLRGDVETVRKWIKERSTSGGGVDLDRLYIVGSGLGAALAAHWTVADAAWPPITSGPQGGDVKGLVLIEPTFVTKGFPVLPALSREPVKTKIPIMVIAGPKGRDADKVFDQLKRWRPDDWFDSRPGRRSPAKDSEATLVFLQLEGRDRRGAVVEGDDFAALRSQNRQQPDPAFLVTSFIKATSDRRP
jgi:pimeloyl-ACP methyl ester carboxylesterase